MGSAGPKAWQAQAEKPVPRSSDLPATGEKLHFLGLNPKFSWDLLRICWSTSISRWNKENPQRCPYAVKSATGKKKPYLLLGGWRQRLGRELDILRFRQSRLKGVSFRKPLASNVGARGELLHIAQRGWIYGGSIVGWVNLHNWRSL